MMIYNIAMNALRKYKYVGQCKKCMSYSDVKMSLINTQSKSKYNARVHGSNIRLPTS